MLTLKTSVLPPIDIAPIPKSKYLCSSLPTITDIPQTRRNLTMSKGPNLSIAPVPKQTFQELPPLQFYPVPSAQDQWMTDLSLNTPAALLCTNIAGVIIPVKAGINLILMMFVVADYHTQKPEKTLSYENSVIVLITNVHHMYYFRDSK